MACLTIKKMITTTVTLDRRETEQALEDKARAMADAGTDPGAVDSISFHLDDEYNLDLEKVIVTFKKDG